MSLRRDLPPILAALVLQASPVRADPPPRMTIPKTLIGVWAGERTACTAPRSKLHLFRQDRTFHPRIFDDVVAHACTVVNVRGHAPNYRIRLHCRALGQSEKRGERPTMQTALLSDAGMRLEINMFDTSNGDPLRKEHLYRCSGADVFQRRPPPK